MPKKKRSKKVSKKSRRRDDDDDDDDDQDYGETWDPDKGESLTGTIVRREKVDTQYGTGRVIGIEDEDGEIWTVWCGAVLKKKLFAVYDEGDEVTITYKGKSGKGQFAKKKFDVEGEDDDDDDDDDDD